MPRSAGSDRTGLKYDMIDSGTTIVRVQADIALRLKLQSRRDQHQLRRNARAFVVADLAQQREVEPREAVALVGAAGFEDRLRAPAPSPGRPATIPTSLSAKYALTEALTSVGPPG